MDDEQMEALEKYLKAKKKRSPISNLLSLGISLSLSLKKKERAKKKPVLPPLLFEKGFFNQSTHTKREEELKHNKTRTSQTSTQNVFRNHSIRSIGFFAQKDRRELSREQVRRRFVFVFLFSPLICVKIFERERERYFSRGKRERQMEALERYFFFSSASGVASVDGFRRIAFETRSARSKAYGSGVFCTQSRFFFRFCVERARAFSSGLDFSFLLIFSLLTLIPSLSDFQYHICARSSFSSTLNKKKEPSKLRRRTRKRSSLRSKEGARNPATRRSAKMPPRPRKLA